MAIDAALDELRRDRRSIDESGARRREIKCRRMLRTETILQNARRRGNDAVGGERRHDDEIEILCRNTGIGKRHLGSTLCQRRDGLVRRSNTPLVDARPLNDPGIVRLHHLLQIKVRQHPFGDIVARSEDACTNLRHGLFPPPPLRAHRESDRAPCR